VLKSGDAGSPQVLVNPVTAWFVFGFASPCKFPRDRASPWSDVQNALQLRVSAGIGDAPVITQPLQSRSHPAAAAYVSFCAAAAP
jgi:hypothetical protein